MIISWCLWWHCMWFWVTLYWYRLLPSSSSSTNFIATQVLKKTSGPLCVTRCTSVNATVAGGVRCCMIYGTVPSLVRAWIPPVTVVTWSPVAACSRLLQQRRERRGLWWSCPTHCLDITCIRYPAAPEFCAYILVPMMWKCLVFCILLNEWSAPITSYSITSQILFMLHTCHVLSCLNTASLFWIKQSSLWGDVLLSKQWQRTRHLEMNDEERSCIRKELRF